MHSLMRPQAIPSQHETQANSSISQNDSPVHQYVKFSVIVSPFLIVNLSLESTDDQKVCPPGPQQGSLVENLPANAGPWSSILIREGPASHRAAKPWRATAAGLVLESPELQLLSPGFLEPVLCNKNGRGKDKPAHPPPENPAAGRPSTAKNKETI